MPPTFVRSKRITRCSSWLGWAGYLYAACREEGGLSPWVSLVILTLRLSFFPFLFSPLSLYL